MQSDQVDVIATMHTILDMIRWAVSQFNQHDLYYGHGTENSWDEAVHLTLASLHLPPDTDRAVMHARLSLKERECLVERIQRRVAERIPVPYLLKQAWFAGLKFYVDERVIIPRSPIAELIESAFSPWVDPQDVHHILDLCTGSGCIAISTALAFPHAEVDAVDISSDALEVAKINIGQHDADNVHLFLSDLFESLPPRRYDLIISNPPYVDRETMAALPVEYHFEPALALESGVDGLDLVHRILQKAAHYLTPNGVVIIEVGASQAALEAAYPDLPFTWLQFEHGGEGVFLLTAKELQQHF